MSSREIEILEEVRRMFSDILQQLKEVRMGSGAIAAGLAALQTTDATMTTEFSTAITEFQELEALVQSLQGATEDAAVLAIATDMQAKLGTLGTAIAAAVAVSNPTPPATGDASSPSGATSGSAPAAGSSGAPAA